MYLQRPPSRPEPTPDPVPLAIRAATLGVIAAALLGILLFRLWALQVLHSDQYTAAAAQNSIRTFDVPSPRGEILDRAGRVIVSNTAAIAVQADVQRMPGGLSGACGRTDGNGRAADGTPACLPLKRLAWVLDVKYQKLWHQFARLAKANPGYPVTLPFPVDRRETAYVFERRPLFPGIQFEHIYQRSYPSLRQFGPVDPNLIGFVGAITAENIKNPVYHEKLPMIGTAGQAGIEQTYDRYLRGRDGQVQETVDPTGAPVGAAYLTQAPVAGDNLKLTIDARLQQAAQRAVAQGIQIAHSDAQPADFGAVVAMDPNTGAIYAMASSPTYSPMVHVPPYKGSKSVFNPKNPYTPGYDKAFQGTYPAGSTFKPIVGTAAYQSGLLGPSTTLDCPGQYISKWDIAKQKTVFHDWTPLSMGPMGLAKALTVSCDTFFYQLGDDFWGRQSNEFQGWIRRFGYGVAPPLDAGGAQAGLVPDQLWKAKHSWPGTPAQQAIERTWLPGDDINLSIGQGNLLVSPLQQAVAYSALENGGKVVTPHVGSAILEPGSTTQPIAGGAIDPKPVRELNLSPTLLTEIRQGLYGATHSSQGTSSTTFANFHPTVYGKTGTAEVPTATCQNCADAWWAGWASEGSKSLVVVAFIHNGGHGGVSAAPVAASVFQAFFDPRRHYTPTAGQDQSR
jgi:penicillin-binding protein 2